MNKPTTKKGWKPNSTAFKPHSYLNSVSKAQVRSDGSSLYIHSPSLETTRSPRWRLTTTDDITNHPLWVDDNHAHQTVSSVIPSKSNDDMPSFELVLQSATELSVKVSTKDKSNSKGKNKKGSSKK